jgi:hypothetical protein
MSMKGKAVFINPMKLILYPLDSAIPTVTTFAEAPMIVPFPPKHAPRASAHQRVLALGACFGGFLPIPFSIFSIYLEPAIFLAR